MNGDWGARLYDVAFRRGFLTRIVLHWWMERLTTSGRILVLAGVVLASFSMTSLTLPLYVFLFLLFFLGTISAGLNALYAPKIAIRTTIPDKGLAGGQLRCTATLTNLGTKDAYDLGVSWNRLPPGLKMGPAPDAVPVVAPGEHVQFTYALSCPRRGVFTLPAIRAVTQFPFSIAKRPRAAGAVQTLAVLPTYTPLSDVSIEVRPRYQPGGISLTSHVGESPEYLGNRLYRPGDALRHIDHRAWARLREPAVREFQEEFYCRVLLVIDTEVARRWFPPRHQELEAVLSLAAALTDFLSQGEFVIDIVLAGAALYRLQTGRHTGQLDQVLEILAAVGPVTHDPFDVANVELAAPLGQMSAVVLVLSRWSDSRRELVRLARDSDCEVKVIMVSDDTQSAIAAEHSGARVTAVSPAQVLAGKVYRV